MGMNCGLFHADFALSSSAWVKFHSGDHVGHRYSQKGMGSVSNAARPRSVLKHH